MDYVARTFSLPELTGISRKQIEAHLALYEGYVKHANLIRANIQALKEADAEGNAYSVAELRRRYAFEFNGMRMHEYYFEQFEGGPCANEQGSPLGEYAKEKYGGFDAFVKHVREVAGSRGIGWVIVSFDPIGKTLHTVFVNDHELGHLAGLPILLALDLWEHAYMVDYLPKEKMSYVDAFFKNLNWSVVERRCAEAKERARTLVA